MLREVAAAGAPISTHPDVTAKMGVKAVLHATRELGWGTDTAFYETRTAFEEAFPARLATGPRVLKQNRGNGGIGVWKVEAVGGDVEVREAKGGSEATHLAVGGLLRRACGRLRGGRRPRSTNRSSRVTWTGWSAVTCRAIRWWASATRWCRRWRLLRTDRPGPRLYSGPEDPRFQRLRALMEQDWTPELARLLGIVPNELPVIWDADLLLRAERPARG